MPRVAASSSEIVLVAGEVQAVFDREVGALVRFGTANFNAIAAGPELQVWRAATDNDGIKLMMWNPASEPWKRQEDKPLGRWARLGLDGVRSRLRSIRLLEDRDLPAVEIVHEASGRDNWSDFEHMARYTLLPSGTLRAENTIRLGEGISDVPRAGIVMKLAPGLERVAWYGRGPWENYPDRNASAMIGSYESTVSEQYVPYIMPQEHGLHTGVRRLRLADPTGQGLCVEGEPELSFSASHFTAGDLYAARHTCDLTPRPEVVLSLDAAHRGLGTASCGPDTLEKYRLLERVYRLAFRLSVVDGVDEVDAADRSGRRGDWGN